MFHTPLGIRHAPDLQPGPTASADAALYARATRLIGLGAWACDLATQELSWTECVFELFGLPMDRQVDRREALTFYCEESRETMERLRAHALATGAGFTMDAQIRRADGELRWMRLTAAVRMAGDHASELYGTKQDVTEEHARWLRLRRMAENDPVTGLANRSLFEMHFLDLPMGDEALADIGTLVLFDLDSFKQINDRWGHVAGDACLAAFGHRLAAAFPEARMIARIGGDEFAMLLTRTGQIEMPDRTLRRCLPGLLSPVPWGSELLPLGASAGIAQAGGAGQLDPEALFVRADSALYRAKRQGGGVMAAAA
ncbi:MULTISPECIES: diguanylate cyclase domain-containing protein [Sphingomonadaceae]|uniref:sensor domain-containing diguanylate cyclase n=1 Tax=Sphingomonadaceae TaxID=41297 RepID=UPI001F5CBAF8|nr:MULTISPECIES: diguanylate cyclase [Sphingomonadaceae]